jgi:hypothetical protein
LVEKTRKSPSVTVFLFFEKFFFEESCEILLSLLKSQKWLRETVSEEVLYKLSTLKQRTPRNNVRNTVRQDCRRRQCSLTLSFFQVEEVPKTQKEVISQPVASDAAEKCLWWLVGEIEPLIVWLFELFLRKQKILMMKNALIREGLITKFGSNVNNFNSAYWLVCFSERGGRLETAQL